MKKILYMGVLAIAALATTSCSSTKQLYSWYNYEDIVYQYSKNPNEKLQAKVPLKEMANYSTSLSSITGGRASFTMKFSNYELVPTDVQNQLIKEFEAQNKDED